jgi:hypothetical protein
MNADKKTPVLFYPRSSAFICGLDFQSGINELAFAVVP